MSAMTDPRELLLHDLRDILFVERTLVKALPGLVEEATDEELEKGLSGHLEETRKQVENVEQAFEALGEKPKSERCPGIEGIKAEHDEFMSEEEPSPEVRDLFLTAAGARAESYEVAAYTSAITLAKALGEKQAASLLEENLRQEKAALRKLETIGRRLARSGGNGGGAAKQRRSSRSKAGARRS